MTKRSKPRRQKAQAPRPIPLVATAARGRRDGAVVVRLWLDMQPQEALRLADLLLNSVMGGNFGSKSSKNRL